MEEYINKVIHGDCLEELKTLPENSVDSIVTDPPYELGFMGKSWDSTGIANNVEMWKECLRVLKPGGHLLAFSGTRTYHRMACAIEDAGFEVRDMIEWVYGSGFPKSLNIGKAVDKLQRGNRVVDLINSLLEEGYTLKELGEKAGIPSLESSYRDWTIGGHIPEERSWERMLNGLGFSEKDGLNIIEKRIVKLGGGNAYTFREGKNRDWEMKITKGTSEWEGWGTALKPAHEPICMARKPLEAKTVAENCLKWGTGGINIDESRVGTEEITSVGSLGKRKFQPGLGENNPVVVTGTHIGRFPANLIHDNSEEVRECFPDTGGGKYKAPNARPRHGHKLVESDGTSNAPDNYGDSGNASRFFKSIIYQAKASKSERNKGCEDIEEKQMNVTETNARTWNDRCKTCGKKFVGSDNTICHCPPELKITDKTVYKQKNNHPTVKPIALMEYLIKMVTPKGGLVLDPFAGSGSTLVAAKQNGYDYIGIELTEEYIPIIKARLSLPD